MRKIRLSLLPIAVFAAAFCASTACAQSPGAIAKALDGVVDQAIADGRLVGAVVLVSHDGKLVYQRAAGNADREANRPMQVDTLFRWSSVSKPVVTAAALALVDQGKLSLDDPVTKWLPTFQPQMSDGTTPVITVRQLLTHTAGINYKFAEKSDGPYHRAQVSDGFDDLRIDLAENVRRIAGTPLLNAPGAMWRYSLSIDVLGAVIAKAAGQSLEAAVARLVTEPLAMKNTTFSVAASKAEQLATPYFNSPTGAARMSDPQQVPFGGSALVYSPSRAFDAKAYPSGGGGMIGTAPDIMRLLEAIRKGGAPILKPVTAASMLQNQIGATPGQQPGVKFGFGGALVVDPTAARTPQSAGTLYWGGVYGHTWFIDPVRKITVVALTNTALEGLSGKFPGAVRDAVYAAVK
jgi:CubicO group peptidase (beta-lactamase class C family)